MNSKKELLLLIVAMLTVTTLFLSCDTTSSEDFEPITVSGSVTDSQDEPVGDAIVRIVNPSPEIITTTDQGGNYTFELQVDSTITYTIEVRKEGFEAKTQEFLAIPERNVSLPGFRLTTGNEEGGDDGGTPPPSGEESEGSAFITLQSVSAENIQVRETGGIETAEFEFMITDSAGTPVSQSNAVDVNFDIASGPGGGESIYPETVETVNGIAKASLTSGTAAGVVQLRASFTRDGNTMQSKPVSITISGGLPSDDHFEVSAAKKNIPSATSEPNEISVLLGDRYGNTVPEGTAVHFSTNKGTINGSATTDAEGYARAQLKTNQTAPGVATVQVETVDENSTKLIRELPVLLSGTAQLSVTHGAIDLEAFTSETFSVVLDDENGNPLAEGTKLTVGVNSDELELSGDTDVTLSDEISPGAGTTEFEFTLSNPDGSPIYQNVTVTVAAEGPNGSTTETVTFEAPDAPVGAPAAIALAEVSETNIHVKETGMKETSTLSFRVTDEFGNPLNSANAADVEFSFAVQPNGGEQFTPAVVTTSDDGLAVTQLMSGTESGVVQVQAVVSGTTIQSSPVSITISGGYPDDGHMEVSADRRNIAASSSDPITVTALLGDRYGNTVPEGTAVHFSTDKGTINGSATTDAEGYASAQLKTNQTAPGAATVRVETVGENSITLTKNVDLLFSGSTQLSVTPQNVNLEAFTSETFSIVLDDENGNPLAEGTTLQVIMEHPELSLSGDTLVTIGDQVQNGPGATDFSFTLENRDGVDITQDVSITVAATGPNGEVTEQLNFEAPQQPLGEAKSISLESISETDIGVQATGQNETSQLTFVVVDEHGNPLTQENSVDVDFRFGNAPGGGEFITDETVTTDASGRAVATVVSGTAAGTVQVIAEFTMADGTTVRSSQPVQLVIHAGLPSQNHFTLKTSTRNASIEEGGKHEITAYVGDKYGNEVPDGTAIYFTTDGGFINGSAYTENGLATTELTVANPIPAGGIATITATTADDNEQEILTTTQLIFSGAPNITVTPGTFNIANAADQQFDYTVTDGNGLPMAEGTTITVTVDGDQVSLLGDLDITVGSPNGSFSNLSKLTDYSFIIDDADPDNTNDSPVQITIEVEGPNGSARESITGRKAKVQP